MQLLITILLVVTLGIITYQDLTSRTISWILFPIGIMFFIANGLIQISAGEYYRSVGINLAFVLFLLIIPISFYRIKSGALSAVFERYIGLGDILMFLLLCFCFSTISLVIFVVCSLLLILIGYGVLYLAKVRIRTIPLAGILALLTIAVKIIDLADTNHSLLNDEMSFRFTNALIRLP